MRRSLRTRLEVAFTVAGMDIRAFDALLLDFGHLPEQIQFELGERLIGAILSYKVSDGVRSSQPKKEAEHLRRITASANQLVCKLTDGSGIAGKWLFTALHKAALQRNPSTTFDAQSRWDILITTLADLSAAAESSAREAAMRTLRGNQRSRGGAARRGPEAKERLNHTIFEIYRSFRRREKRDWEPKCDAALKKFVRNVYKLADSSNPLFKGRVAPRLAASADLTAAIASSYKRWIRSKQKRL